MSPAPETCRGPSVAITARILPRTRPEARIVQTHGAVEESGSRYSSRQLDPYVARMLGEEPPEVQRAVIGILSLLKSVARGMAK